MSTENITPQGELFHPFQLELFQLRTGNEKYYSNTIEFWDIIPKFFYGRMERKEVIDKKSTMYVLPSIIRDFKYNPERVAYNIVINPAIIVKNDKKTGQNVSTYFYPSTREELVEEVLRKYIAQGKGGFLEDDISVYFSLREIQEDLKNNNHTYSIAEIKEALDILSKTHIEITSDKGDVEYKGNMIVSLLLAKKGRGGVRCFCSLSPLVSRAVKQLKFRKYDYTKCIGYQIPLSRYIHKRISHYYKQIDRDTPYIILMSTLLNDSGYLMHESLTKNYARVESVLIELKKKDTIMHYTVEPIKEKQVKLKTKDYKICIIPSNSLVDDIISANAKENKDKMKARLMSGNN